MSKFGTLFPVFVAAAFMAACASGAPDATTLSIAPAAGPGDAPRAATSTVAASDEGASKAEPELDCKKLTGRMQIRILEMRTFSTTSQTSGLSRTMHAAGTTMFGGASAGIGPNGEVARDYATLENYNRQLVSQDCRSFDIQQSLAGQDTPPQPTVDAPSKSKAARK